MSDALMATITHWLTCPEAEVRAAWIPSQAAVIMAIRERIADGAWRWCPRHGLQIVEYAEAA